MQDHSATSVRSGRRRGYPSIIGLLLCAALHAQKTYSIEIKLLLPPASIKSAISSLNFGKQTNSQIYLFDADNLSRLAQGVIVRARQAAKNDLTVKVRLPEGISQIDRSKLQERLACVGWL